MKIQNLSLSHNNFKMQRLLDELNCECKEILGYRLYFRTQTQTLNKVWNKISNISNTLYINTLFNQKS